MDGGTLYQLRNLINRRNVISSPENDVNASEDFLTIMVKAHVVAVAMEVLGMCDLLDSPNELIVPPGIDGQSASVIESLAQVIVSTYVDLTNFQQTKGSKSKSGNKGMDHIQEYAKEVVTLGFLYLGFQDAFRKGDGLRVLTVWKYLFLIFRATGHTNYTQEEFTLLAQYYCLFPPRYAEQLLTARFVNSKGGQGNNVAADLHMEHLNCTLKECMRHLGANRTPQAVVRASRALLPISRVIQNLDGVQEGTDFHTKRSDTNDLSKLISQLVKSQVFVHKPQRAHHSFPVFKCNIMHSVNKKRLNTWMHQHFCKLINSSTLNR